MAFARIHQYLSMATPLLWTRQPDTVGVIGLALNATYDRDGHTDERERIKELLIAARELWRLIPEVTEEPDQLIISRMTFRLIHLADILAVTPEMGAPVQSKRTESKRVDKSRATTAKLGA
jgi:hypothetical protein